jgi:hypothetical protein
MYTLQQWLQLDDRHLTEIVVPKVSTVVVYLNGTRRWFLSQHKDWSDYIKATSLAHRKLNQLFYDHGIRTLIQPLIGYDLLDRGYGYLKMAVEQGLTELVKPEYLDWYEQMGIRVTLYGNWSATLSELGFSQVIDLLKLITHTAHFNRHSLLMGAFADEGLDRIISMAKEVTRGEELIHQYYGQPVGPVDLIIGSGQPVIWDIPLLDINKASLYFMQAPTFCLDKITLRSILYDHLYHRLNDDDLYDNLEIQEWSRLEVLGLGQRTPKGWVTA